MQIKITRSICYLLCVNHVDFRSYESAFMPWLLENKEQKSQPEVLKSIFGLLVLKNDPPPLLGELFCGGKN
jgi:hypothetical protein